MYNGGNVVGEIEGGTLTATYLRGANLLSTDNGTSTSYYLFNAHGDVTGLTNGAQTVTKAYDYDAFGNENEPSATEKLAEAILETAPENKVTELSNFYKRTLEEN